jgi:hypothetical protein
MRWPPDCEDVSPEAEERPLLEAVTKQRSEDRDWEYWSLCDSELWSVVTSCVFKVSSKSDYRSLVSLLCDRIIFAEKDQNWFIKLKVFLVWVSEEHISSIFRNEGLAKQAEPTICLLFDPEDLGDMLSETLGCLCNSQKIVDLLFAVATARERIPTESVVLLHTSSPNHCSSINKSF